MCLTWVLFYCFQCTSVSNFASVLMSINGMCWSGKLLLWRIILCVLIYFFPNITPRGIEVGWGASKVAGKMVDHRRKYLMVVTSGKVGHQAEEGGISGIVYPEVSWTADSCQKGCSTVGTRSKNMRVGEVQGGYGEGLFVGLKEILANHLMTSKAKTGPGPGYVQQGRRTADSDLAYRQVPGRNILRNSQTNMSFQEESESQIVGEACLVRSLWSN